MTVVASAKVLLDRPWEVGSDFHWPGLLEGPFIPWPQPQTWFARGQHAVLATWNQSSSKGRATTLHVPDYFCPEVTAYWQQAGVGIRRYADDPRWSHPHWDTLRPKRGDVVLAVNYFGVREGKVWQEWHRGHQSVVLIEDHSHDPVCSWALSSQADYAFASVRKTFPVPDGALLWSPRGHTLPPEPHNHNWAGSALKLAAMIWKKEYLAGDRGGAATKNTFRAFQIEGEKLLTQHGDSSLPPWSRSLLAAGIPERWRQQRESNVRRFLDLVREQPAIEPLFTSWPTGHCPLNAVLVFPSETDRAAVHTHLAVAGVYAPMHWTLEPEAPIRALDLSKRILSIPLDQRYDAQDVHRIVDVLRAL